METLSLAGHDVEIRIVDNNKVDPAGTVENASGVAPPPIKSNTKPPEVPLDVFWSHFGDGLAKGIRAVLAFSLTVIHLLRVSLLPEPDLASQTLSILSQSATIFAAYWIFGRFLLAPGAAERRLLPLPRADRHFRLLVLYGATSQSLVAVMNLSEQVGGPTTFSGLFSVGAFTLMVFKVWWFLDARHDLQRLILGHESSSRGPGRRIAAAAAGWIYALCFVVIWMVGNTATEMENGERWVRAGTWTQVIIIFTPILAAGLAALATSRPTSSSVQTEGTPASLAFRQAIRAAAGAIIWIGGLLLLARHWASLLFDVNSERFSALAEQMGGIAALAFTCWLALVFLRRFFEAYTPQKAANLPCAEDEAVEYTPSRLTTVLPVLRVVLIGTVLGVATLTLLSQLGVDTGPLLAGFGIFGLAVSFGSQALIKDIVSGIFFLAEDAFRVGEYVDTGGLKGTVEKITVRSMQLRHHNGPIHTIPFGQLNAITNLSRDWGTIKFELHVDREVDPKNSVKR